jgi:serine/threonine-protein kinase
MPQASAFRFAAARVSPDGNRIVLAAAEANAPTSHIWVYSLPTKTLSRLTFDGNNFYPAWMPGGRRVSYSALRDSSRVEKNGLYTKLADGSAPEELLLGGIRNPNALESEWAPDGNLVFRRINTNTSRDIGLMSLKGDGKPRALVNSTFDETSPAVSRDGRWLAYVSNESGVHQVYVRPYPSMAGRWQISSDGGVEPLWGPNGRELLYWNGTKLMSAEFRATSSFDVVRQTTLFEMDHVDNTNHATWDVFPKGDRFVLARSLAEGDRTFVVVNWFEELERRARPAKR